MTEISALEKHACPACGAQAEWDPARQMLRCPFCGTQSPYQVDRETGQVVEMAFDRIAREQYTAAFDAYAERVRHVAQRSGGRYLGLPTSVPVDQAIFGPLVNTGAVA